VYLDKGEKILNLKVIIDSIRSTGNKDTNAYKITEYYNDLINGSLDEGGIVLATSKIRNIEKYLKKWSKKNPNSGSTIMQPEENAIILIDDLRKRRILK
jgi:hypothetical protein